MKEWTSYSKALEVLHSHGQKLSATDFSPYSYVLIHHEEGTTLIYASAFILEWKDWVFVYTEHHGEMAFHRTDLRAYHHLVRSPGPSRLYGTGKDNCEECGSEELIEDLLYGPHPDPDKFEENHYVVLCGTCLDKYCGEDDGNVSSPTA